MDVKVYLSSPMERGQHFKGSVYACGPADEPCLLPRYADIERIT
jgi:hypothetical protein